MTLIPSRRRVELLNNLFESAVAAKTSTPGVVLVDADDFLDNSKDYFKLEQKFSKSLDWRVVVTSAESMGDKLREKWPLYQQCDWVNILNDDHFIITEHWDKKMIAELDGKNIVSGNDRWMAPQKMAGATFFSGPLMRAIGYLYPPDLQHLFIDDLWERLGRVTGCWKVMMDVVVEHRHAMKDESPKDDTYKKVYSKPSWDKDHAIYHKWLENDFAGTVARIKALQSGIQRISIP